MAILHTYFNTVNILIVMYHFFMIVLIHNSNYKFILCVINFVFMSCV